MQEPQNNSRKKYQTLLIFPSVTLQNLYLNLEDFSGEILGEGIKDEWEHSITLTKQILWGSLK